MKSSPPSVEAGAARAAAAEILRRVLTGRSLDDVLTEALARLPQSDQAPLIQEMVYGSLRWALQLRAVLARYLDRPLKKKDQDLEALLLVGLYQLMHMRVAPHAAVTETVAAAGGLGKGWAKGLVNAVLREFLRRPLRVDEHLDAPARFSHPAWLIDAVRGAWPEGWQAVLAANNAHPPMSLRVNLARTGRAAYLQSLQQAGLAAQALDIAECALVLQQPVAVERLPNFAQGWVSVQDVAAQFAALLLDPCDGEYILDACAAPGGKTGHILERAPAAEVVALDRDPQRLERVHDTLRRLDVRARVIAGDAAQPQSWWDRRLFHGILLDAPCSATGVIRRHPDIKLHRQPADVVRLAQTQQQLLEGLWPLLAPGGRLVYATCSILPQENEQVLAAFCARRPEATARTPDLPAGVRRGLGWQILPGDQDLDGFFYARLEKAQSS